MARGVLLLAMAFAGCAPVQPDVSGHTILNMMLSLEGEAELTLPALGALYEDVQIVLATETGFSTRLGRDGQEKAQMRCARAGSEVRCKFVYSDAKGRVDAFVDQVAMWSAAHVAPLNGEIARRANPRRELFVERDIDGALDRVDVSLHFQD